MLFHLMSLECFKKRGLLNLPCLVIVEMSGLSKNTSKSFNGPSKYYIDDEKLLCTNRIFICF